jgi:hypothetical protein
MQKAHRTESWIFADSEATPCRHTPWRWPASHGVTGLQQNRSTGESRPQQRETPDSTAGRPIHQKATARNETGTTKRRPPDKKSNTACRAPKMVTTVRTVLTKGILRRTLHAVTVTVTSGRRTAPWKARAQNWAGIAALGGARWQNAHHILALVVRARAAGNRCGLGRVWTGVGRTREPSQNACEGTPSSTNQRRWLLVAAGRGKGASGAPTNGGGGGACRPWAGGDVT